MTGGGFKQNRKKSPKQRQTALLSLSFHICKDKTYKREKVVMYRENKTVRLRVQVNSSVCVYVYLRSLPCVCLSGGEPRVAC